MATPTSHPHPQKQPIPASHPTPASASSPPAPPSSHSGTNRSIPSPAYSTALKASSTRPFHQRNGSAQLPPGSTPRAGPSTGTPRPGTTSAMADSPAAAAAAAMLMDGGFDRFQAMGGAGMGLTPRGVGLTPTAMQMSASMGGINAIVASQDQEEERKRRVEAVVGMMGERWGWVSQEGVERCARRLGLECLWEEGMGEERKRTLTVAGDGVLVDVEFRGEEVRGVVLQFEGSGKGVVAGARDAAEVLAKNLKGNGDDRYVALDGFVGNLQRLGTMDRLGGAEVNCFDATDGIYRSLEKVFSWDLEDWRKDGNGRMVTEVMCERSGRPKMHTRGHVGLALQYWMERRLVHGEQSTADDMDIDQPEAAENEEESVVWLAIIECEASPAELYPPIRLSDAWASKAVEKPAPTEITDLPMDDASIDWQDPPALFLAPKSPTNGAAALSIENAIQPRSPDIRFVAKFEPPVIVPLQTAIQLHISVGAPLSQQSLLPTTYESLVFADIDSQRPLLTSPRTVEKTVVSCDPATETSTSHIHRSSLLTQPNDYARAITHLPFSHPRQIIALLPTLRQWALTASLLRRSFVAEPSIDGPAPNLNGLVEQNGDSRPNNETQPPEPTTFQTIDAELADFMASPLPNDPAANAATAAKVKAIDITLTTTPLPRLNIHFPNPRFGGKLASIGFNVGLNGMIAGIDVDDGSPPWDQNGFDNSSAKAEAEARGKERVRLREKVKKVLEVGESIGVCVEWMTRK